MEQLFLNRCFIKYTMKLGSGNADLSGGSFFVLCACCILYFLCHHSKVGKCTIKNSTKATTTLVV